MWLLLLWVGRIVLAVMFLSDVIIVVEFVSQFELNLHDPSQSDELLDRSCEQQPFAPPGSCDVSCLSVVWFLPVEKRKAPQHANAIHSVGTGGTDGK